MRVERIDHLVLTVADIERSVRFHTRVMGMQRIEYGAGRIAQGDILSVYFRDPDADLIEVCNYVPA